MKQPLILAFVALFTCKALAQKSIEIKDANKCIGQRVPIDGYVSAVKVITRSSALITIADDSLRYAVNVHYKGSRAAKIARSLYRKRAASRGVFQLRKGKPVIYTSPNRMGLLELIESDGLSCIEGDPQQTIRIDSVRHLN